MVKLRDLGRAIKCVQHRHHCTLDHRLAPLGITLVQWDALRHVSENPGASSHDLARLTFQTDQAFGTLSSRLLERGWIERRAGSGRAIRHHLTRSGKKLLARGSAVVERALEESFAPLTPRERNALYAMLSRVIESSVVARRARS